MIRNQEQFETALETVQAYLAEPPRDGGPEDANFSRLLVELKEYRATLPVEAEAHPAADALAKLENELDDFRQRYPERDHSGRLSHFGFGQDIRGEE